jgi:threonine/homoserine efflux transporter RhtA
MPNDPINTVAQLWLWRLEGDVLGAVIGCLAIAIWAVVHIVFGQAAGQAAMDVIFTGVILAVPASLLWFVYNLVSPAAGLRRSDKALNRYRALLDGDRR